MKAPPFSKGYSFVVKRNWYAIDPDGSYHGEMTKPLIGMTGRRWPASALANNVPKAMYDLKFDLHFSDYPASVAAAGGLPVELTRDADVEGVLARLDGLILSGGADAKPASSPKSATRCRGCTSSTPAKPCGLLLRPL